MKTEILSVSDQLVAAGFNGFYQGILLVVLVALGLRLLPRTNAATRHAVWFSTLLVLAGLMVAHCLPGFAPRASRLTPSNNIAAVPTLEPEPGLPPALHSLRSETDADGVNHSLAASPAPFGPSLLSGQEALVETEDSATPPLLQTEATASEGRGEPSTQNSFEQEQSPAAAGPTKRMLDRIQGMVRRAASAATNPVSLELALGARVPRSASLLLLVLWLSIAGFRVFLLLLRLHRLRRLKSRGLAPSSELSEMFQDLRARLAVNRNVAVKVSPAYRSPLLLGFLHPVILLPDEAATEETEHVLRHELAHAGRRDDWANLVQHFIHAVFFFHPGVWWISKRLSLEREIACDDHVLQQSRRPRAYALLLANLAGRMHGCPPALAPGASTNKSQLKKRIDMILNTKRNTSPRLAKTRLGFITTAAAMVAIAALYSAPRIVLAQAQTAPVATSAAASSASADAVAASAPVPVVASALPRDTDLPGTASPDVGPRPKYKPDSPSALPLVVDVTPAIPFAPAPVTVAPAPPMPMLAPVQPFPGPRPPRATRSAPMLIARGGGDAAMEERLERLERMVESLLAQRGRQPGQPQNDLNDPFKKGAEEFDRKSRMFDRKEMEKDRALPRPGAMNNQQQMERNKELAERQAKMADEHAKNAARAAERALKQSQRRQFRSKSKDAMQGQLEALRQRLKSLEREKEELDRQIEALEQNQEQLEIDENQEEPPSEPQPEQPEAAGASSSEAARK